MLKMAKVAHRCKIFRQAESTSLQFQRTFTGRPAPGGRIPCCQEICRRHRACTGRLEGAGLHREPAQVRTPIATAGRLIRRKCSDRDEASGMDRARISDIAQRWMIPTSKTA